jgi:hypothetical protein
MDGSLVVIFAAYRNLGAARQATLFLLLKISPPEAHAYVVSEGCGTG